MRNNFAVMVVTVLSLCWLCSCMQLTGMKKAKLGTWEFEANSGFEAKAGVQQYDFVSDKRGIGIESK